MPNFTDRLRTLDPSISHFAPQAIECALAFIKVPSPDEEFGQEAGFAVEELGWGRPLMAQSHGKDASNRLLVTLYDGEICINKSLVQSGLARIDRKAKVTFGAEKTLYNQILQVQQKALKGRLNIWQYGDIESDDERH